MFDNPQPPTLNPQPSTLNQQMFDNARNQWEFMRFANEMRQGREHKRWGAPPQGKQATIGHLPLTPNSKSQIPNPKTQTQTLHPQWASSGHVPSTPNPKP
jgi:hypothetical protein